MLTEHEMKMENFLNSFDLFLINDNYDCVFVGVVVFVIHSLLPSLTLKAETMKQQLNSKYKSENNAFRLMITCEFVGWFVGGMCINMCSK